jgi:hypothetical protein
MPPFVAHFECAYEFLGRWLYDDATAVSFAHKPLSLVYFAVGVEVRSNTMPQVVFDLACILVSAMPSTLFLAACLKHT